MNSDDKLPLSAFMPNHSSLDPHAPFIATAGKNDTNNTTGAGTVTASDSYTHLPLPPTPYE